MSYRNQSNLKHKLQVLEKAKAKTEDRLERLETTQQQQQQQQQQQSSSSSTTTGKRGRNDYSHHHDQKANKKFNDNSLYDKMFQRKNAPSVVVVDKTKENESNLDDKKSTAAAPNRPTVNRNRMFVGLLNKTLQDFQKDIVKKTDADIKREEVDQKIDKIIDKEKEEAEEREKVKKQQLIEKEQKQYDEILKKQEIIENRLLQETWSLHKKTLSHFPYKTKTKPCIYFTLSPLADKHRFKLPNYFPQATSDSNGKDISSTKEDKHDKRRKRFDDDDNEDKDEDDEEEEDGEEKDEHREKENQVERKVKREEADKKENELIDDAGNDKTKTTIKDKSPPSDEHSEV